MYAKFLPFGGKLPFQPKDEKIALERFSWF